MLCHNVIETFQSGFDKNFFIGGSCSFAPPLLRCLSEGSKCYHSQTEHLNTITVRTRRSCNSVRTFPSVFFTSKFWYVIATASQNEFQSTAILLTRKTK
jgi:hypothetical protein